MNNVITFTPSELVAFIGTIAGVCAGIATIVGVICKVIMRLKAPEVEQNNRIKALEEENKSRKEEIEELKKRIGGILTAFFIQKEIRLPKIVYTSILMIYKL